MTTDIIPSYVTTDILLASVLRLLDYKLELIKTVGKGRAAFYFVNVSRQVLFDFDAQQLSVEPIAFNQMRVNLSIAVKRIQE
jgi:hypothetical protein